MTCHEYDVLIVGAGVSGLSTAYHLRKLAPELSIGIIEGRNRIGGRVHSIEFANGRFDIGATFIHSADGKNPIYNMAMELGLNIHHFDWSKMQFIGEYAEKALKLVDKIWDEHYDISIYSKEGRMKLLEEKEILEDAALSLVVDRLKKNSKFTEEEISILDLIINFEIHSNYAEQIERLSALHFNQDSEWEVDCHYVFNSVDSYYQMIVDHLAKDFTIHLNSIVREIHWDDHHQINESESEQINRVICENNEIFIAKKAIVCTLPLSILKTKKKMFSPELPREKLKSIQSLGMSLLNLILLEFEEHFWDEESHVIMNLSPAYHNKVYFFCNMKHVTKRNILRCYIGSDFAREIENFSDQQIVDIILENLQRLFGKTARVLHYYISRWGRDPFSLGSYSHIPPGASGEDYDIMSKEINNKLFFAGEATHRSYPSTVHGAFLSGSREANKIASLFLKN